MKKILPLLGIVIVLASCKKKNELGVASNNTFDLDKFEKNIQTTYGPKVTGYSYTIAVGNKIMRHGAAGKATRTDADVPYTIETRQEIFSVTKFITAIAVMKLLQEKNKTPDDYIYPYLPESWTVHPSHNKLTFRRLLSHNSGFQKDDRDYTSLKAMMALPQGDTARTYNNANFALCRILLPYLKHGKAFFKTADDANLLEPLMAIEFRTIIREMVLKPSGLTYWEKVDFKDWNHQGNVSFPYTVFYRWNSNMPPATNSDDVLIAGSRGLVLSSYEVAQVMLAFENNQLVASNIKALMKTAGCGFDRVNGFSGAHGQYYWKNGVGPSGTGPGGECIIMSFPNSVYVSINSNSNINDTDQFVAAPANLAAAYDAAW